MAVRRLCLILCTLLLGACSGGSAPSQAAPGAACTPGQSVACIGPAGCQGGQVCSADGRSFDACVCGSIIDASVDVARDAPSSGTDGTLDAPLEAAGLATAPDGGFLAPYMGSPSPGSEVLKLATSIRDLDVAFVVQTTGSTVVDLDSLRASIATSLLPALTKAVPSVAFALVDYKDCGDAWAVEVRQTMTTDLVKVQTAVNAMSASGGGDEPSSQINAMLHTLTGDAIGGCSGMPGAHTPGPGTQGGVDFRAGAKRVILLFTHSHWHDPDGSTTLASLKSAFNAESATFVELLDTAYLPLYSDLEDAADGLSDSTKSNVPASAFSGSACGAGQCCTGVSGAARPATGPGGTCRLNFLLEAGVAPTQALVEALQAISVGTSLDITTAVANDPANPIGIDATGLLGPVRAMDEGDPANGCPAHVAKDTGGDGVKDTFTAVAVGTPVCFEVKPKQNVTIAGGAGGQSLGVQLTVLGMPGSVVLDRRTVTIVVPPG